MSRAEATTKLTALAATQLSTFAYSALAIEIGLPNAGRADVLSIDWSGNIRIIEIKSCRADFTADKKWKEYLRCCDYFYFAAPGGVIDPAELPKGIGLFEPFRPTRRNEGGELYRVAQADYPPEQWSMLTSAKRPRRQKQIDLNTRFWIMKSLAFRNTSLYRGDCPHCGKEVILSSAQTSPDGPEEEMTHAPDVHHTRQTESEAAGTHHQGQHVHSQADRAL